MPNSITVILTNLKQRDIKHRNNKTDIEPIIALNYLSIPNHLRNKRLSSQMSSNVEYTACSIALGEKLELIKIILCKQVIVTTV